eukprot:CAMPEP_0116911342 /NCGR_PEP_ID=MMETSP0467-20121206/15427_1 /TAXON_ID=283647 /ORGANISM="Mesodinium pulex, Strain SPMC105" /LENGTH=298 /DNA_ID=CAMNT_0004587099 /DNA_START=350 /DNA_END=1245 /DNA_ORIENTATION=+
MTISITAAAHDGVHGDARLAQHQRGEVGERTADHVERVENQDDHDGLVVLAEAVRSGLVLGVRLVFEQDRGEDGEGNHELDHHRHRLKHYFGLRLRHVVLAAVVRILEFREFGHFTAQGQSLLNLGVGNQEPDCHDVCDKHQSAERELNEVAECVCAKVHAEDSEFGVDAQREDQTQRRDDHAAERHPKGGHVDRLVADLGSKREGHGLVEARGHGVADHDQDPDRELQPVADVDQADDGHGQDHGGHHAFDQHHVLVVAQVLIHQEHVGRDGAGHVDEGGVALDAPACDHRVDPEDC